MHAFILDSIYKVENALLSICFSPPCEMPKMVTPGPSAGNFFTFDGIQDSNLDIIKSVAGRCYKKCCIVLHARGSVDEVRDKSDRNIYILSKV